MGPKEILLLLFYCFVIHKSCRKPLMLEFRILGTIMVAIQSKTIKNINPVKRRTKTSIPPIDGNNTVWLLSINAPPS